MDAETYSWRLRWSETRSTLLGQNIEYAHTMQHVELEGSGTRQQP